MKESENMSGTIKLKDEEKKNLISKLEQRFEENMLRHEGVTWDAIQKKIEKNDDILNALNEMEKAGGEPDVVNLEVNRGSYHFIDCSRETPEGHRNLCYDDEALHARKKNKPEGSAKGKAEEIGVRLLTEDEYRKLQSLVEVDTKTSSWIETPTSIRKLGGALFGDRRFNTVFIYHNGAESYYGARGFRGILEI